MSVDVDSIVLEEILSQEYKLFTPPKPNMQMRIGRDSNTYFTAYCEHKPNRFQRWMLRKFFAMYIEDVE